MIAATRQHIGLLVLAVMDSETRDVESVLSDFKRCLNTYELWVESYVSFSALDVDQVFKVGSELARVVLRSAAAAAPTRATRFYSQVRVASFGPAAQPNAGQACSPQ
ncbi:hypothetical protein [Pseudomonas sp. NFX183]|uniref:hypothetical protein n=1 Tax=Pseudomonas sp. NFX183 TaxID=3399573 RepID=UPI003A5BB823